MEKKSYLIPALLGLGGIAIIYVYFKNKKKRDIELNPIKKPTFNDDVVEPKVVVGSDMFPLGVGSKGYNVEQLQIALGGKSKLPISFKKGKPDGIFGLETETLLKEQAGVKTVSSIEQLDTIASKNGLVKSFTKKGYTYIPKSKQSILAGQKQSGLPLFKG